MNLLSQFQKIFFIGSCLFFALSGFDRFVDYFFSYEQGNLYLSTAVFLLIISFLPRISKKSLTLNHAKQMMGVVCIASVSMAATIYFIYSIFQVNYLMNMFHYPHFLFYRSYISYISIIICALIISKIIFMYINKLLR